MSCIVVVLKERFVDVSVLKDLHALLGGSLAKLRTAINGELPLVEMEIFDNQYEAKADLLRKLIALIRLHKVKVDIYELPEGDSFQASNVRDESLIDDRVLENILNSADSEMNRSADS